MSTGACDQRRAAIGLTWSRLSVAGRDLLIFLFTRGGEGRLGDSADGVGDKADRIGGPERVRATVTGSCRSLAAAEGKGRAPPAGWGLGAAAVTSGHSLPSRTQQFTQECRIHTLKTHQLQCGEVSGSDDSDRCSLCDGARVWAARAGSGLYKNSTGPARRFGSKVDWRRRVVWPPAEDVWMRAGGRPDLCCPPYCCGHVERPQHGASRRCVGARVGRNGFSGRMQWARRARLGGRTRRP